MFVQRASNESCKSQTFGKINALLGGHESPCGAASLLTDVSLVLSIGETSYSIQEAKYGIRNIAWSNAEETESSHQNFYFDEVRVARSCQLCRNLG
jgi:hypothetical protein